MQFKPMSFSVTGVATRTLHPFYSSKKSTMTEVDYARKRWADECYIKSQQRVFNKLAKGARILPALSK